MLSCRVAAQTDGLRCAHCGLDDSDMWLFSATGAVTGNMAPTRVTQQAPNNTRSALQRLLSVKGSWRNNQEFTQSKRGRTCPLVDLLAADNYGGWREGSHSETTGYPMGAPGWLRQPLTDATSSVVKAAGRITSSISMSSLWPSSRWRMLGGWWTHDPASRRTTP